MENDTPFGVIWKEWIGTGDRRKVIQKSLGFNSRHQFVRYADLVAGKADLENFVGGWRPEGPLSAEEMNVLTGFVPKEN